jgi:hypothetical protein
MKCITKRRVARAFNLIAIGCVCLLVPEIVLYGAEWQVEYIDAGGGGKYSTLLMDKAGNGHVSYANEGLHELRYGFWDHVLRKWFTMVVDRRSMGFVSMALDSQNRPHIAFQNYGAASIKYAHWDGAWKIEQLATGASLLEYYTGITLDRSDQPVISYYEILRPGILDYVLHLRTIRREANAQGEVWRVNRVDGTPGSGKFNSLVSGGNGEIGIAYANVKEENASLRYARWAGSSWEREILIGAEGPRHILSVAAVMGKDATPHISFADPDQGAIRYATKRGGSWQIETVSRLRQWAFPDRNGITLDEEGNPYMTFFDAGLGALILAYRLNGRWMTETVDGSANGFTSSIQVRDGEIMITYHDAVSNSLKCYRSAVQTPHNRSAPDAGRHDEKERYE